MLQKFDGFNACFRGIVPVYYRKINLEGNVERNNFGYIWEVTWLYSIKFIRVFIYSNYNFRNHVLLYIFDFNKWPKRLWNRSSRIATLS